MMGKRHPQAAGTASGSGSQRLEHVRMTTMIHPSDPQFSPPIAVRDGQGAPVTCAACGCRLAAAEDGWFHFSPNGGRDARGCRIDCSDVAHDATGRAVALLV